MSKRQLLKKYDHQLVAANKFDFWNQQQLFKADLNSNKPPFAVVLPPPNVTGHLHIGHAYGFTLPDIIVRYKKLQGYDAFIIPGTDHAGIATQTKYEKILKENEKTNRFELGREAFLKKLVDWKDEQAEYIKKQWSALVLSLDYSNYMFTLDSYVVDQVKKIFVQMYKDNIIYRAKKLVNWDVELKTAISNIEVIHKEINQTLYYIKYETEDHKDSVIVATSRPETMYGDKHLVMNPNDERYTHLFNKTFINPLNKVNMSVILDDYIDVEFGTGVMKCTPAHDFNDYELAKKHNLELINIMNDDGTLNEMCAEHKGLDRLVARELIVEKLKANGSLIKTENYTTSIGFSERTNSIVEPYLSWQWFIKMDPLVKKTIKQQLDENLKVDFYPNRFNKTLMTWLESTEDWCISRQLWWGHQIPVYYHKQTNDVYCDINPPADLENWTQDEDVLDTWFSSGIWPIFTTKYEQNDAFFKKYYPTALMVTGVDILFFWVSRMMNFAQYLTKQKPFNDVLIHGLIRDSLGRKMSKSLNNGIDPFDVIDQYGVDAMRLFFASSTTIGEDLNFSDEKLSANWNYLNKIWNIGRYINDLEFSNYKLDLTKLDQLNLVNQWILAKLSTLIVEIKKNMDKYNLVVASKDLYDFIWNTFASDYLEYTKVLLKEEKIVDETKAVLRYVFNQILIMLHPFAPCISEELYSSINDTNQSILLETYPNLEFNIDTKLIDELQEVILSIRKWRLENDITNKEIISFDWISSVDYSKDRFVITKLLSSINVVINQFTNQEIDYNYKFVFANFILGSNFKQTVDLEAELKKVNDKKTFLENEIKRAERMLNNEGFTSKAPASLIAKEQEKLASFKQELNALLIHLKEIEKKV
ncbi:valine--tRNA ligase [Ureaplasma diversum]|uniref:Valine--tRNA ligase n=1 Tax=Ureaplasma diversum NCTC 246 TaxID=1188241 RepID=A0A084EXI0_9BACT|nr:valine--tRNA ligase [Ureaplasma diversum]KEZ22672.1 Valine-tRNA ligase [Ureaplasma diversum NCTC 246]